MLRRVDADDQRPQHPALALAGAGSAEAVVPAVEETENGASLLPRDHPKWVRDAVTISQRARELAAHLRPIAIKILTFWDHRVRSAFIGGNRISIDTSGSYRLE
jgi:hypothetical protein